MKKFKIIKIKNDIKKSVEDAVAEEISLTIAISSKELVTLLSTPDNINDLVSGYLFTSGIIQKAEDIKNIDLNKKKQIASVKLRDDDIIKDLVFKRLQPPGCGKGFMLYNIKEIKNKKIKSDLRIKSSVISNLMADFQKLSETYLLTGGTHSAAIADKEKIIVFREDIGRHNAVDKVIGSRLMKHDPLKNKLLLSSGRISSEIYLKAQMCQIPVIVSISAPTDETVRQCRKAGITLIGFARGKRMNIYSHEERII